MGVGTTTIRLSCGLANAVIDKTLHEMEAQVWQNFTNFLWNHMEFVDDDSYLIRFSWDKTQF